MKQLHSDLMALAQVQRDLMYKLLLLLRDGWDIEIKLIIPDNGQGVRRYRIAAEKDGRIMTVENVSFTDALNRLVRESKCGTKDNIDTL